MQIDRWRDLLETEQYSITPKDNAILMVILYKPIRPQPFFSVIVQNKAKVNPEDYGYVLENGKAVRVDGHYMSKQMLKIHEWAEEHELICSFARHGDEGPFLDDKMLEVHGNITKECMDRFPIPWRLMNVVEKGSKV